MKHTLFVIGMILLITATLHVALSAHAAVFDIPSGDVDALIDAISQANANGEEDTINLEGGTYTLADVNNNTNGPNGLPSITSPIIINGVGVDNTIIERDASASEFRIFQVASAGFLRLDNVTIQGGQAGGGSRGGGVLNEGTATFTNCTITDNRSADGTGGLDNRGTATLSNCTISNNEGGDGAGGLENFGTVTLTDSTISGNVSSGFGDAGGMLNIGDAILTNCTISNNDGLGDGVSFGFGGIENAGIATLTNCTISGNKASQGGGILNDSTLELNNSIVANNTSGGDCFGGITSLDYNLDSDGTCNLTQPNDRPNTDPLLGPLQNNGGPTDTHALLDGSPAIDAIPVGDCVDASGEAIATDQRSVERPQGAACDIGAYEFELIQVVIDIMPSDPGNNLNLRAGQGAGISVAILSVGGFGAPNLIDPLTLEFGPGQANISGSPRVRDVDGDGNEDLVVKFLTHETGIACGDTEARLSGRTFDLEPISGSDATNTFNCPRTRKRY
jgi:hypothetical protein